MQRRKASGENRGSGGGGDRHCGEYAVLEWLEWNWVLMTVLLII